MLPITIGIFFFIALIIFLYFISNNFAQNDGAKDQSNDRASVAKEIGTPLKKDIVLAELTDYLNPIEKDYGILWNAEKGTYDYSISTNGKEIAKGTTSSENNMFKIRGIPLERGSLYTVQVGNTLVDINFSPPSFFLETLTLTNELECNTDIVPTNLEIVSGSVLIPKFNCHIKLEPPGLICDVKGYTDLVLMIYNGPNAVNILSNISPSSKQTVV